MRSLLGLMVALCVVLVGSAEAQTVRFDTNVGHFDLELNPTGNGNLLPHVDNMLAYVNSGRYDLTVINRAAEDFVLQMGGFNLDTLLLPDSFSAFPPVVSFDPVIVDADFDGVVDFDVSGLTNTRGTVSLALSNSANTGTSSFFVNLGTNSSLDADSLRFVPFARVKDMTTIDLIMSLNQASISDGGLASADIPLTGENRLVFVERAFVLQENPAMAGPMMAMEGEGVTESLASIVADAPDAPLAQQALIVPEPPALVLAVGALVAIYMLKPNKLR